MKRSIAVCLGESAAHVGTLYHDAVGGRERSAFIDLFADAFEHIERTAAHKAAR